MYIGLGKKSNDLLSNKISIYMSSGVDTRKREERATEQQTTIKFKALEVKSDADLAVIYGGGHATGFNADTNQPRLYKKVSTSLFDAQQLSG